MKILGIIAEYNPFHNGHLFHLQKSKEITNCDYTIAVISGNFTERGSTSLIDKWSKANIAIKCGIDLVIELPVLYSISSAENFADGAIKILNSLNVVDYISFGAETSSLTDLDKIANILSNEPKEYKLLLTNELALGNSFPKARENALNKYLGSNFSELLYNPNNILGIEYLKSLKKYKSNITPILIHRTQSNYNDNSYSGNIASATAIRELIKNENYNKLKDLLPKNSYTSLINNKNIITDLSCFEKEIIYTLRKMEIDEIRNLADVSEGLEFNIKKAVNLSNNLSDILENIKTKRYTLTRLQRIFLYSLLGITKQDIQISKETMPYIRILGFNENGKKLLSKISKLSPQLKIITSLKKFIDTNTNKDLSRILQKDILSTNIYTLAYKNNSQGNLDFTTKINKKEQIGKP